MGAGLRATVQPNVATSVAAAPADVVGRSFVSDGTDLRGDMRRGICARQTYVSDGMALCGGILRVQSV